MKKIFEIERVELLVPRALDAEGRSWRFATYAEIHEMMSEHEFEQVRVADFILAELDGVVWVPTFFEGDIVAEALHQDMVRVAEKWMLDKIDSHAQGRVTVRYDAGEHCIFVLDPDDEIQSEDLVISWGEEE